MSNTGENTGKRKNAAGVIGKAWEVIQGVIPFVILIFILQLFWTNITLNSEITGLKNKLYYAETGVASYKSGDTVVMQNGNIDDNILKLVQMEQNLAFGGIGGSLRDVYMDGAALIKKTGGVSHAFEGLDKIREYYSDPNLKIYEINKFNFRVYNTRLNDAKKPVEANVTYDMLIKFSYNGQTYYELKQGKELMDIVFDEERSKWLIKYFYMEQ